MSAKTYLTPIEVRAYELDSFGHVNHANYFHYLETARWKMLGEEGITLDTIRKWDRWPVIAAIEMQYRRPVLFGDVLEVRTRLAGYRRSSMHIEQDIYRGETLVASAKIRSVIVSGEGRPAEMPKEMAEKWRNITGKAPNE
jgi:YbgC/YbaW family acyl-CoA thioester hydrolase